METGFALLLSFFAIRGFRFDLNENGFYALNTRAFFWLPLFLFFSRVLQECFRSRDRRLKVYAGVFGILTGCFYSVGLCLFQVEHLSWIFQSSSNLVNFLNMTYAHAVLYFCCAWLAFRFLAQHPQHKPEEKKFSMRKVLILWAVLLLWYIPWYLYCYPGCLTPDSYQQISDALAYGKLDDFNPAFVNLLIRLILRAAHAATGSVQAGVGICTFLQMLVLTFLFALCQERIGHTLQSKLLRGIIFCAFLFYPVHNIYSITMWKDILFSGFLLGFTLCLDAALTNEVKFFNSGWNQLLLFASMLLPMLFRHNGILVILPMTLILPRYFPKRKAAFLRIGVSAVAVFVLWQKLLLPQLGASATPAKESISIPLQQIARTLLYHRDELSTEEFNKITAYFKEPEVWEIYMPGLADPVKADFINEKYVSDPASFFSLWAELGRKYPMEYLDAFLHGNYGYWYPETDYWISWYGFYGVKGIEDLHFEPLWKFPPVEKAAQWYINKQYTKTPLLPLLFSRGACFWLWLFCGLYCLYNNRRRFPLFLTGFFLWFFILFSAVYAEFRYVYGLFTCLPLLLVQTLCTAPSGETQESLGQIKSAL